MLVCVVILILVLVSVNNKHGLDPELTEILGSDFLHTLFGDYLAGGTEEGGGAPSEGTGVTVHFIDVGQGKSILIEAPEKNVLIDAGERGQGDVVLRYLASQKIRSLDIVIGTHPHSDHIGGLSAVITDSDVKSVILPEISEEATPTTPTYTDLLYAISDKNLAITPAKPGKVYDLGDGALLTILGPLTDSADLNDMSVVSRLDYGENSFLFTGDATKYEERDMLEVEKNLRATVLDVGHHGSSSSSQMKFLRAVNPNIAVISCAVDNSYGHPHREVVERLGELDAKLLRTDLDGHIMISSDSKSLSIKTQK